MAHPSLFGPDVSIRHDAVPVVGDHDALRLLVLTPRLEDATRITRMLSRGGTGRVGCEAVQRTRDALRRLRAGGFDAALVDSGALNGDGLRDLERLCDFATTVPVLLLVSETSALAPAEAIRRGAQDVLRRDRLTPGRLAAAVACGIERQRRMVELHDLTLTDPLTSLHNRRGFRTLAEAHLRLVRRTQGQSLLLFADVDLLKQVNDLHGHAAGDLALQLCAQALTRSLRASDILARYGGDEFVSLALNVSDGAALVLLPRLSGVLAGLVQRARLPFSLTMSVGTATFGRGTLSLDEVLARADRALYGEKRRRGATSLLPCRDSGSLWIESPRG